MSSNKDQIVETNITKVVVYLDGARVTRKGKISLAKGQQKVKIKNITKHLINDSVRVSGKGKGSLGAIDIEKKYHEETIHEEIEKLRKTEKSLQKELSSVQQKVQFFQKQQKQLDILGDKFSEEFPVWLASGEAELGTLKEFFSFQSKSVVEKQKRIQKLQDNIEDLKKQLSIIQAQINTTRNRSMVEESFEISISIHAKTAGDFEIELVYQTHRVSWEPIYDIELESETATIQGQALVRNNSLEDWKDVNITISTAVFQPV